MTTRIDDRMPAGDIMDRIAEAQRIARSMGDDVVFSHNGTDVRVRVTCNTRDVYDKWRLRRKWAQATDDANHKVEVAEG